MDRYRAFFSASIYLKLYRKLNGHQPLANTELLYALFYSDPNTPVDVEQMKGIKWPKYDIQSGKYLAIGSSMSEKSVRKQFCADSFHFWYKLIPKVMGASKPVGKGGSYFKRTMQESCDSDQNCPP